MNHIAYAKVYATKFVALNAGSNTNFYVVRVGINDIGCRPAPMPKRRAVITRKRRRKMRMKYRSKT